MTDVKKKPLSLDMERVKKLMLEGLEKDQKERDELAKQPSRPRELGGPMEAPELEGMDP